MLLRCVLFLFCQGSRSQAEVHYEIDKWCKDYNHFQTRPHSALNYF
ncbi:integrase core domain-containing protein [Gilliamella sp. ESL0405]|nr:transposase [Gilliamella sp. ESL0405]